MWEKQRTKMQQLGVKLFIARTRNRGLRNTTRLLRYHADHFLRYNTPVKVVNFIAIKFQKRLRCGKVWGMPYRYNIDPTNVCNLRCPVCPTGLGTIGNCGSDRKIYIRVGTLQLGGTFSPPSHLRYGPLCPRTQNIRAAEQQHELLWP